MEPQIGGNSFQDRPGARMRVVVTPEGKPAPGRIWGAFAWTFKLFYALAAAAFCVAIASFAPVGGPAIAAYVPRDCTLLIHTPSGAAIHRALLDSPAFAELLDDPDTAEFVESFIPSKATTPPTDPDAPEPSAPPLRTQFDTAYAKVPWPVTWLIPPNASGIYPFIGSEVAVALERIDVSTTAPGRKKSSTGALIFTRVSESRGHLARLAAVFLKPSKSVEVFDLGGGLIAIGLNGARPEFEQHTPPPVVSANTNSEIGALPLLQISFGLKTSVATEPKESAIDLTNPIMEELFEREVPRSVLSAIQKPPTIGEMLNWKTQPKLARINFFAESGGNFAARGRIEGDVPTPPVLNADATKTTTKEKTNADAFAEFSPTGPMAEFALPIDLRACFLKYVEGGMRIPKDAKGITKSQRQWISRFNILANDNVDLDAAFWPFIGHVALLEIHEAKKDEDPTSLGIIRAWLPCDIKSQQTLFAAADLARARWEFLYDSAEKVTTKTGFVRRFRSENELADTLGDRYVLATGKISSPSWSVGTRGLRITTDAGIFALRDGPKEADFIAPPKSIDAYHIRLDGPRLASTAESLATYFYDELEYDVGSQNFLLLYPDHELHCRLARKWTSLMGKLALEIAPDVAGAELKLSWKPASMAATATATETPKTPGATPPKTERKDTKKDPKKSDSDDAPPPPPAN